MLTPRLLPILDHLVAAHGASGEVTLDQIGEALGTLAADAAEVSSLLDALELDGLKIAAPPVDAGEALQKVLPAARALRESLGRRPSVEELAGATGLTVAKVRAALLLGQVLGRG